MEAYKLCESDYKFIQLIWESEPIASGELVKLSYERLGWKKSTTFTMIKKLADRGLIQNRDAVVSSVVPKELVQQLESEYFINRAFSGSLAAFVSAFAGGKGISDDEAKVLHEIIDKYRKENVAGQSGNNQDNKD